MLFFIKKIMLNIREFIITQRPKNIKKFITIKMEREDKCLEDRSWQKLHSKKMDSKKRKRETDA